jgi:transcriptional regulator with XRE-family HTH domain
VGKALRTPLFGQWLAKQRGSKSLEKFAIPARVHAKRLGLKFDRSQIAKLEEGRLPSVPMLWVLAPTLSVSVPHLEAMIVAELRGDLVRAESTHEKKSAKKDLGMTFPDISTSVQRSPHISSGLVAGGPAHDPSSYRVSPSDPAVIADIKKMHAIAAIIEHARAIRALSDDFDGLPGEPGASGGDPSGSDAGGGDVRGTGTHPRRRSRR